MKQKTVVITGGGQGLGKVIARDLLRKNLKVAIFEIDREAGTETAEEFNLPGRFLFLETDISSENQVKKSIQQTIKAFGSLDFLINNAAIAINKPMHQLTLEEWYRVLNVNLSGAFICAKYAVPYLKNARGSIINLCSTRAFMSEPDTEAYSASKGGIYALTHALAMSLGPDICVNSISPGWIDVTSYQKKKNRKSVALSGQDHEQHPAGRVGKPEDISSMVLYLIDDNNRYITGQNFMIDGGMTKKMIYV